MGEIFIARLIKTRTVGLGIITKTQPIYYRYIYVDILTILYNTILTFAIYRLYSECNNVPKIIVVLFNIILIRVK